MFQIVLLKLAVSKVIFSIFYFQTFQERVNRPQSTLAGGLDDISSPDLGVDVGSDPYSSLERRGNLNDDEWLDD